jgi:hypothetical protein
LVPIPRFFEEVLADDVVLVSDGQPTFAKPAVDVKIVDHHTAAVVTCEAIYETSESSVTLKFMRVWLRKNDRWQIVAGTVAKKVNGGC